MDDLEREYMILRSQVLIDINKQIDNFMPDKYDTQYVLETKREQLVWLMTKKKMILDYLSKAYFDARENKLEHIDYLLSDI